MSTDKELGKVYAAWLGDEGAPEIRDALADDLDALYAAGPGRQATEHAEANLRRTLQEEKTSVVYYDVLRDSSLGTLFVAVSRRGVVAVALDGSEQDFVAGLCRMGLARPVRHPERTAEAIRQLSAYLAGERAAFDLPLDLRATTEFQRKVLMKVSQVPRGEVITYGELARRIGRPQAARAVGQALGKNPVPIIIPCHRVLASDGSLGGYSGRGGVRTKAALLRLEGALP